MNSEEWMDLVALMLPKGDNPDIFPLQLFLLQPASHHLHVFMVFDSISLPGVFPPVLISSITYVVHSSHHYFSSLLLTKPYPLRL